MRPYSRRKFLGSAALGTVALGAAPHLGAMGGGQAPPTARSGGKFKLKYAPSLGMFEQSAGKGLVDQIKFIADQGFRAIFDNGLMGRPPQEQEAVARELARLGLDLGPFVAYADFQTKSFVTRDAAVRQLLEGRLKTAVECAKRTGAKQTLVVPGRYDERLEWDYQTANVVENLKWAAGIVEPAGLIVVVEPLNPHDHPGLFLTKMPQAYQVCRAVRSPACKIIEDIYHQQITEGNIIPNIDACFDEIAAFHCGDTPGRNEPGTGELNYRMIFKHLHAKKYDGVICMEHGKSRSGLEGEKAVIEAYRVCDNF